MHSQIIPSEPIRSWQDAATRMQDQLEGMLAGDWWLYRGVTDAAYPLIPTIGRPSARVQGSKLGYSVADERALLAAFKAEARPYLTYSPQHDLEWLTLAQHHGVPTRLLDWTESFQVALYFAVQQGGFIDSFDSSTGERGMRKVDAALYYTKNPALLNAHEAEHPFDVQSAKAYSPAHISPHVPAQRSIFTIQRDPTMEPDLPRIRKSIIDADACAKIKMILDNQGVNAGSLFPTIDGLGRHMAWRYKWGKLNAYAP